MIAPIPGGDGRETVPEDAGSRLREVSMRRAGLVVLAALALGVGTWFLVRTREGGTTRPLAGAEPRARSTPEDTAVPLPVLVGQPAASGAPAKAGKAGGPAPSAVAP